MELEKKENWIKVNKLILNSNRAFNPQIQEIVGNFQILINHGKSGKTKGSK